MTIDECLAKLDAVKPRGPNRWMARCPSHADRRPSLQVTEGDKAILLKCWSGCSLTEICTSLSIHSKDLFFNALDPNPQQRKAAAQKRARKRRRQQDAARKQGRRVDACREAERFIHSRQGLDITDWTDGRLTQELDLLADAYCLLEMEECL